MLTFCLQTISALDNSYKIPFVKSDGLMLVEATIDGDSGYLIFDTGTDALILNRKQNSGTVSFQALSGEIMMSEVKVSDLNIGKFSFSDINAYARDLSQLEGQPHLKLLGIIGAQLFSSELLHIDNDHNIIEVYPRSYLNQLSNSNYVTASIEVIDDIVIVPVTISDTNLNFILDSGASTSFVDSSILDKNKDLFSSTSKSSTVLTADNNSHQTKIVTIAKAKVANLAILDLEVGLSDFDSISSELGIKIDGILSLDQLPINDILIDFGASKIYIGI